MEPIILRFKRIPKNQQTPAVLELLVQQISDELLNLRDINDLAEHLRQQGDVKANWSRSFLQERSHFFCEAFMIDLGHYNRAWQWIQKIKYRPKRVPGSLKVSHCYRQTCEGSSTKFFLEQVP